MRQQVLYATQSAEGWYSLEWRTLIMCRSLASGLFSHTSEFHFFDTSRMNSVLPAGVLVESPQLLQSVAIAAL